MKLSTNQCFDSLLLLVLVMMLLYPLIRPKYLVAAGRRCSQNFAKLTGEHPCRIPILILLRAGSSGNQA